MLTKDHYQLGERGFDVLYLGDFDSPCHGNKYFKLLGYLDSLPSNTHILSVGGAYSNHLYALTAFAQQFKISAFVREPFGEFDHSHTIQCLEASGIAVEWVSSNEYQRRYEQRWIQGALSKSGADVFIPEGGNGANAEHGIKHLARLINQQLGVPTQLFLAAGTGVTAQYLERHIDPQHQLVVVPVVRPNQFCQVLQSPIVYPAPRIRFGRLRESDHELIRAAQAIGLCLDTVYTVHALRMLLASPYSGMPQVLLHTGGLRHNPPSVLG
ncbi:MAG: hypothetical protein HWD83_00170 [Gammaproteobacteria bacterium]|nr:hypothetical protein [Gammaproteobacteria bacterium]